MTTTEAQQFFVAAMAPEHRADPYPLYADWRGRGRMHRIDDEDRVAVIGLVGRGMLGLPAGSAWGRGGDTLGKAQPQSGPRSRVRPNHFGPATRFRPGTQHPGCQNAQSPDGSGFRSRLKAGTHSVVTGSADTAGGQSVAGGGCHGSRAARGYGSLLPGVYTR